MSKPEGTLDSGIAAPELCKPKLALGAALCASGLLGLLGLVMRSLPFEAWGYLTLVGAGAGLLLMDFVPVVQEYTPLEFLSWYMQHCTDIMMRICILAQWKAPSAQMFRKVFADAYPTTLGALCDAIGFGAEPKPDVKVVACLTTAESEVPDLLVKEQERPPAERDGTGPHWYKDAALAWLRGSRCTLGFDEQLRLYGIARQAEQGDCAVAPALGRPAGLRCARAALARAKRSSWEAQRGLPRDSAAARLVQTLADLDPAFRRAHPRIAALAPPPRVPSAAGYESMATCLRLGFELAERLLPADVEVRLARGKQRLLEGAIGVFFLAMLHRATGSVGSRAARAASALLGRLPVKALAGLAACFHLLVITYGLPPELHALLPPALRRIPEAISKQMGTLVGGSAPRLCRWAAQQALAPPVRGSLMSGDA